MHLLERRTLTLAALFFVTAVMSLSVAFGGSSAFGSDRIDADSNGWCTILTDGTAYCRGSDGLPTSTPSEVGPVKQIAAESSTACAVRANGTAACWGPGAWDYNTPGDLGTVKQISMDGYAACAVRADNTLRCWGANPLGQLNVPGDIGRVKQVSVGAANACAVKLDGTPVCWGSGAFAQDNVVPENIGTVLKIVAGAGFNCAIRANGKLQCWGLNDHLQLTNPSGTAGYMDVSAGNRTGCAVEVSGVGRCWGNDLVGPNTSNGPYMAITTGNSNPFYCGILVSGGVSCWGNRATPGDVYGPGPGMTEAKPLQISAGWNHSCVVLRSNGIRCWGDNSQNQSTPPVGSASYRQVAAGYQYTCAIKDDSTLTCWGDSGNYGSVPGDLARVRSVSLGTQGACVIDEWNQPRCWSANQVSYAAVPEDIGPVTKLTTGATHACAIKVDGTPVCWGTNTNSESTIPGAVGLVTDISAGDHHTCVLKEDGTPYCWGDGYATFGNWLTPTTSGFESISSGYRHDCAQKTDGTTSCWGGNPATYNDLGQSSPPAVLSGATQLAGGSAHSCALNGSARVACWGNNNNGQGDRSTSLTSSVPPQTINAVSGSYSHTFTATSPLPGLTTSFLVTSGNLPPGLSLNPTTGVLSGTATEDGSYPVTVIADDGFFVPKTGQSFTITVDLTPPPAPTSLAFDRSSPSSSQDVFIRANTEAGATVRIYKSSDCSGPVAGSALANVVNGSANIGITGLPADGATTFSADAVDNAGNASSCSDEAITFITDNTAPDAPSNLASDPASPGASTTPHISGEAEAGSTVHIYRSANCSGDFDSFDAEGFANGVELTVEPDSTTTFSARAEDSQYNLSTCSDALSYTHVTPPGVDPTGSTGPSGPGTDNPSPSDVSLSLTAAKLNKICIGRARGATRRPTFSFRTNQSASVRIALQSKKVSAKKLPRRCVKKLKSGGKYSQTSTGKGKKKRKLTKTLALGAGAHKYDLLKTFKLKSLKSGFYRVVVSATAADGKSVKANVYLVSLR
jgi:alpha-tubulin suppressor-like RCC1 family protein